jgi:hydrogenase-4 component B
MGLVEPGFVLVLAVLFLIGGALLGWVAADKVVRFGEWECKFGTYIAIFGLLIGSLLTTIGAIGFWQKPMTDEFLLFSALSLQQAQGLPPLEFSFLVDRLSAFMLILTGLISAVVAVYSLDWFKAEAADHNIPQYPTAVGLCLLVLCTVLLLTANNVFCFLLFLECITLAFGYLTLYRHQVLLATKGASKTLPNEELDPAKAAFKVYLVSSHLALILIAAALLILALGLGSEGSSLSFQNLRNWAQYPRSSPEVSTLVFLLALAGFGIKSAVMPFHSWLPLAHPYLPTNVHALVSSVVIKVTGLYGLIRVLFEFLPAVSWWGGLLMLLAGLTALVGVLYAIFSHDLKTALANHSVENIGIMLAGIGLALLLNGLAQDVYQDDLRRDGTAAWATVVRQVAGLALLASLYHILNHAIFKALLFLGTGAIENRMRTVKLNELGGLITHRRYYLTAGTFLVGAVAIAGFPPFNGFVSEWLTLQSLFAALDLLIRVEALTLSKDPLLIFQVILLLLTVIFMLALAFGLTALAFVKIAGVALLGAPRNQSISQAARPNDVPRTMGGPLLALAVGCLLLGVLPGLVASQLALLASDLVDTPVNVLKRGHFGEIGFTLTTPPSAIVSTAGAPIVPYSAEIQMLPLFVLPGLSVLVLWWLSNKLWWIVNKRKDHSPARTDPWNSGSKLEPTRMQISDTAFGSLLAIFVRSSRGDKSDPVWRLPITEDQFVIEYFLRVASKSVEQMTALSARFGGWMQNGSIQRYLFYLFATFVVGLFISIMWMRK